MASKKYLAAASLMGLCAAFIGAGDAWRDAVSPHFWTLYQGSFMPSGLTLDLEKLHNRLRMDLAMFSPWMEKERISLYLYPNRKSYLSGEFQPPNWSTGMAFYQHRSVVTYDPANHGQLVHTISHEMTHLLFESYWGEVGRAPPQWLNEGLAMMEENQNSADPMDSEWAKALSTYPIDRLMPFQKVMEIVPVTDLKDKDKVALWYLEAYGVVYFLYRAHTRLQFSQFCAGLRDQKTIDQALWDAYRFRDSKAFESAWKDWLKETFHMLPKFKIAGSGSESKANSRNGEENKKGFRSIDFSGFNFHSFREK